MQSDVRDMVIGIIEQIQSLSGRELPAITGATCPLTDIPGFDSHNALEVLCFLSAELGWDVPSDLMVLEGNDAPLTIDDIVDRLVTMVPEGQKG